MNFRLLLPIVLERFHIFLQKGQDGAGRVTVLDLVGERIFVQIYASLFGIFVDGIENRLKVRHCLLE
jgi:hypothetical protein